MGRGAKRPPPAGSAGLPAASKGAGAGSPQSLSVPKSAPLVGSGTALPAGGPASLPPAGLTGTNVAGVGSPQPPSFLKSPGLRTAAGLGALAAAGAGLRAIRPQGAASGIMLGAMPSLAGMAGMAGYPQIPGFGLSAPAGGILPAAPLQQPASAMLPPQGTSDSAAAAAPKGSDMLAGVSQPSDLTAGAVTPGLDATSQNSYPMSPVGADQTLAMGGSNFANPAGPAGLAAY